jgi:hypothetical protein
MQEYKNMPGCFILPEPRDSKIKFVHFKSEYNDELVIKENNGILGIKAILFKCEGTADDLLKMIYSTANKFDVQKIVWIENPITYEKQYTEGICCLITEGNVNTENLLGI